MELKPTKYVRKVVPHQHHFFFLYLDLDTIVNSLELNHGLDQYDCLISKVFMNLDLNVNPPYEIVIRKG